MAGVGHKPQGLKWVSHVTLWISNEVAGRCAERSPIVKRLFSDTFMVLIGMRSRMHQCLLVLVKPIPWWSIMWFGDTGPVWVQLGHYFSWFLVNAGGDLRHLVRWQMLSIQVTTVRSGYNSQENCKVTSPCPSHSSTTEHLFWFRSASEILGCCRWSLMMSERKFNHRQK